jgi:hypothetical protein
MNQKTFYTIITHNTPYDTNMFLYTAEGGERIHVQTSLQLMSFGGTSVTNSDTVHLYIVSDSDTSGSNIIDSSDLQEPLGSYMIPDGWPRPSAGIGGMSPFNLMFQTTDNEFPIPARGRNLYVRLAEPSTLPDPNAEYSIRLEVTVTRI